MTTLRNDTKKAPGISILVAEDDPASLELLKEILTDFGHKPIPTKNGKEALAVFQSENPPQMAILDWMMPKVDGLEVCKTVRRIQTETPPYIIMLTAKRETEDIVCCLEAGADDYIPKPYNSAELAARIKVGTRMLNLQEKLRARISALKEAQNEIKTLHGILPICSCCHKIKDDDGSWQKLESYIRSHSDAKFSHGYCDACAKRLMQDIENDDTT